MSKPRRPALRWHGGKWLLAPWIVEHFPPHRVYVEPFGGAASVLLRKRQSYAEIYNDLDGEVVNLFRVCRGARASELVRALELTPFARDEFLAAYEVSLDEVEEARRLVVRSFMGFGSDGFNRNVKTGFRAKSNRSGTTPARDWGNIPDNLRLIIDRFVGVTIENRPALQVMQDHDASDTLHYLDPPYMPHTRSDKSRKSGGAYHTYNHEMTLEDHAVLLVEIQSLAGAVLISGYPSELYDDSLAGWRRLACPALADGARERTEVLWLNPACADRLQPTLL